MNFFKFFLASFLFSQTAFCENKKNPIDSYLQSILKSHVIPGFSVVVVKDNKVIYSKGYGVETMGLNKAFTPNTFIAVGSLTKSFTALAMMKLVEQGKVGLDVPVVKYLPWFHTANKEESDKITIRMLLNNTSGLYPLSAMPSYDISENSIETFVRNLSSVFLYREPGSSYEYSNAGFIVAGLIISKVSGMKYSLFLEQNIFLPLSMKQTTTNPNKLGALTISQGHYSSIKTVIPAKREPEFELTEFAPAGSLLHSSASDLGKYLVALLNISKTVSSQTKKELWSSYSNFPGLSKEDGGDNKPFGYGLGWMVSNIEGRNIIHHGGSTGKTSSFTMIDTTNKIAASILMNIDMTFIDKYAYPTEFTILNNVMRLATNLPKTEFGKPTIKDPTLSNFKLNELSLRKYIGEYKFKKGGDAFVYFGVDMKIQRNEVGKLEAIVFRGNQTVNRFLIDFVNESSGVSRNIFSPSNLRFKLAPNGEVLEAFFSNIEFTKVSKEQSRYFTDYTDEKKQVSFQLPRQLKINNKKSNLTATDQANEVWLSGDLVSSEKFSFEKLFETQCGLSATFKMESKMLTENIGSYIWQEKLIRIKKGLKTINQCFYMSKIQDLHTGLY
jgi:CubicO group peptidase (beta-lactamase class C family)